jgi:hypothetical protein
VKPVTMYECPHCEKLFKTPNKHNCKRDPAKTNCYSCEYWLHQFYLEFTDPFGDVTETKGSPEESCLKHETSYAEEAHALMRESGWKLNCPDYKRKEVRA